MRICDKCGHKLGKKDKFCGRCGSAMYNVVPSRYKYCLHCGEPLENKAKFCSSCGKECSNIISFSFLDDRKAIPDDVELDFLKDRLPDIEEEDAELTAAREAAMRAEEAARLAEEAALKAQEEKQKAEEVIRKAEEERLKAEEAIKKAEEDRKKAEEEVAKKAEEKRIREEEERKRAEEERKRREEEEQRRREEAARLAELERKRLEEEARKKAEEEKKRAEEEARRKAEEERKRKEEEERRKAEEAARLAEEKRIKELEEMYHDATTSAKKALEKYAKSAEGARGNLEVALDKLNTLYKKADVNIDVSETRGDYYKIEEILGITYYLEGAYKLSIPLLRDAADNGSCKCRIYLTQWLLRNRGELPSDQGFLLDYIESSIKGDVTEEEITIANRVLAKMYRDGIGVKRSLPTAFEYFKKAADAGDITSVATVG